jgi:regulator of replication initiation timing
MNYTILIPAILISGLICYLSDKAFDKLFDMKKYQKTPIPYDDEDLPKYLALAIDEELTFKIENAWLERKLKNKKWNRSKDKKTYNKHLQNLEEWNPNK